MTPLQKNALGTTPLSAGSVQTIYSNARLRESVVSFETLERLCLSHERLRAEVMGAEKLLDDLAAVEQALREFVPAVDTSLQQFDELAELWGDEGKFRAARDRLRRAMTCPVIAAVIAGEPPSTANKRKDGE